MGRRKKGPVETNSGVTVTHPLEGRVAQLESQMSTLIARLNTFPLLQSSSTLKLAHNLRAVMGDISGEMGDTEGK